MTVRYAWRPGSRVKIDAEKAGKELSAIEFENNGLTAEAVVERARSQNSSLHDHFEWNDALAAEEHRLSQARDLIGAITVHVVKQPAAAPTPIRAFVNVVEQDTRHYISTTRAMSDDELRQQVLAKAWADLEAWQKRYAELTDFAAIFTAIDQARTS